MLPLHFGAPLRCPIAGVIGCLSIYDTPPDDDIVGRTTGHVPGKAGQDNAGTSKHPVGM